MPHRHSSIAQLTVVCLLLSPAGPATGWQAAAAAPSPQTTAAAPRATAAAQAPGSPAIDDWPRGYTTPSGARLTLYQPQIASWPDEKHVAAYVAVSYLTQGAQKPALGT